MMVIRKSKASSIQLVFAPVVLNLLSCWIMPDFEDFFWGSLGALPTPGWVLDKLVRCPK
jgi:hypothetical protein